MATRQTTDILLVGKTGNGKSATANSLVGRKVFESKRSSTSVTKKAQFDYGEFEGRILKVVDGPGICDTSLDNKAAVQLVADAMTFAVAANPTGYHAILLVVRYDDRFTKEDVRSVQILKDIFGQDFIRCHGILLMTNGDDFEDEEEPFDKWILSQVGPVQDLTKECSNRVLLFDNRTNDMNIKKQQIRKLLEMIDNMVGNGARYTSDIFNVAKESRDNLIKKSKKPKLSDESLIECALINQQLSRIDYKSPEEAAVLLESLKKRTDILEQDIIKQDKGTNSLSGATFLVQQLKESLSASMTPLSEIITRKQQMEKRELELKMERTRLEEDKKKKEEDDRRRLEDLEKQRKEQEALVQQKELELKLSTLQEEAKKEREDKRRLLEDLEKRRKEHEALIEQKKLERRMLQEEENRKREEERRQHEETEQQKKEFERLIKQNEEDTKKTLENIRQSYETVKNEATWTWGSVASALAAPVAYGLKWWLGK